MPRRRGMYGLLRERSLRHNIAKVTRRQMCSCPPLEKYLLDKKEPMSSVVVAKEQQRVFQRHHQHHVFEGVRVSLSQALAPSQRKLREQKLWMLREKTRKWALTVIRYACLLLQAFQQRERGLGMLSAGFVEARYPAQDQKISPS